MKKQVCQIVLSAVILAQAHTSFGYEYSCEDQVGQMIFARVPAHKKAGGIVTFRNNFPKPTGTPSQVKNIIDNLKVGYNIPPFIVADQEGGLVQRFGKSLGFTNIPSAMKLGTKMTAEDAIEYTHITAKELKSVGVNMVLAPVADIAVPKSGFLIYGGGRAYSQNPIRIGEYVSAVSKAFLEEGVMPVLKHFPGHGYTSDDSHKGHAYLKRSLEQLNQEEFVPYREVVRQFSNKSYSPTVLIGHLSLPLIHLTNPETGKVDDDMPASLSPQVVTGWLRKGLGHKGLIITDDLAMGAVKNYYSPMQSAKMAVKAGVNILSLGKGTSVKLQGEIINYLCHEAQTDRDLNTHIAESFSRILKAKQQMGLLR